MVGEKYCIGYLFKQTRQIEIFFSPCPYKYLQSSYHVFEYIAFVLCKNFCKRPYLTTVFTALLVISLFYWGSRKSFFVAQVQTKMADKHLDRN